ncbi:DUF4097 family beta strand repeat-containing protein [Kitasatospora sp. NPDC101183]|uniref:DUF4097 family beta strand repeat-containing protein n=1 Tax=Kitasatospora sp. NPDC101183 TaxID=3364100 RepID=UPI00381709EC
MRAVRIWRITGVVTVLFVLLMGAGQTLAVVAKQQRQEDRVFTAEVHKLQLSTGSSGVSVRAGAPGRVVLHKNLDWTVSEPKVRADVDASGVMTLDVRCRRELPFYNCGAQLELEVPAGTEVAGEVTSGSVTLEGLTGPVDLGGTSGAIYLNGLSGEVRARTSSGMVQGTALRSGKVEVSTASGAVDLGFATAPRDAKVSTGSGAASVTLPQGSHYRISGRSGSGGSTIDPALGDATSPNSLTADVGSGSLDIGYGSAAPKAPAAPRPQ